MPWSIKKQDGKFCVVKDEDGSTVKCHATRAEALAQQKALYASETKTHEKAEDGAGEAEVDHTKMLYAEPAYVSWGVTSFAELRAAEQAAGYAAEVESLSYQFRDLAVNILNAPDIEDKAVALEALAAEFAGLVKGAPEDEDKEAGMFARFKDWLKATPMKTVDGKKYPASDFLVAEDPDSPSTWHLQIKRNGKPDRGLAGAAWAALFSPGGHRGNKYAGPGKEAAGKKLRALYKAEDWELPGDDKEAGLMLWKEADGTMRWLARYSNNRRDQDRPPEIISAQSHRRFDDLLSKGQAPYPELWLWHRPEWRWGVATWHAYDDSGFAVAGGVVDKGKEFVAEHLMALDPALVRVSHGMPTSSIVRDTDDESVIVEHLTREISPLPAWAAANQLTGFSILKEVQDMAIPQDKRDALKDEWNLSDELLTQLEAANAADAKGADEAGIEAKEVTPAVSTVAPTEPEVEVAPEAPAPPEPGISREELTAALTQVGQAIAALTAQVKELQGDVIEVKETKAVQEADTLSEIFQRAIGHPATRVDGRTTEAKDRPKETRTAPDAVVNSGHPLADTIINSIVSGDWLEGLRQGQH